MPILHYVIGRNVGFDNEIYRILSFAFEAEFTTLIKHSFDYGRVTARLLLTVMSTMQAGSNSSMALCVQEVVTHFL